MKLYRYEKLDSFELSNIISENTDLKYDQIENVIDALREYYILKRMKPTGKNFLYRLTLPFLFLLILFCLVIIMPIRWIFTGHYGLEKSKFGNFIVNWQKRVLE